MSRIHRLLPHNDAAAGRLAGVSLRTKLILAFLLVSLLSGGIISYFTSETIRTILARDAGASLEALAATQGRVVGDLLSREIRAMRVLAADDALQDSLVAFQTLNYEAGDPAAIQAEVARQEERWRAAGPRDFLVVSRLHNEAASALEEFRQTFPDHVEILLADRYGALIAATDRPPTYDQTGADWWQTAFAGGQGAVFIGQPEFDQERAAFIMAMAVPVYAPGTQEVLGVLRTTYRLAAPGQVLATMGLVEGQPGGTLNLLVGDQLLGLGDNKLEQLDPGALAQLEAIAATDYGQMDFLGVPSLISLAPVVAPAGDQAVADLGWRVLVHRQRDEALAPVRGQQRSLILLALGALVATAAVAVVVAQMLVRPVSRLTQVAERIAAGDLAAQAQVEAADEVGKLARAFNVMTEQLHHSIDTLEERVAARTRQLELVVNLSHQLSAILDLGMLMREVVNTTKENFDYYHVHIYLLDERRSALLMAEGYGQAGVEMKRQAHSIALDAPRSLVAQAAREGRIVTVENVADDPHWLPNPLLPETKSEMAVPVMLGREVVGVLDVQSEKIGGLTAEDEMAMQALANQIAVAVRNARYFTETQEALYRAQKLQNLYTGQAWQRLLAERTRSEYEYRRPGLPPLAEVSTPEVVAAVQQKRTVVLAENGRPGSGGDGAPGKNGNPDEAAAPEPAQPSRHGALATPLKLHDEIIGVLGIRDENPERRWTDEEIALLEAVGEQMSLAIENARLFEETGRRARREKIIADMTRQVWASGKFEQVLRTAVEQLGVNLEASKVVIRVGTADRLEPDNE